MKSKIQWRDEYATGLASVDEQHKKLIALMADLQVLLKEKSDNPRMGEIIKELVEYTRYHFKEEETIMRAHNYDQLDRHLDLHRQFANEIAQILVSLKAGKDLDLLSLFDLLRNWFINHILREDTKIAKFVIASQNRASATT